MLLGIPAHDAKHTADVQFLGICFSQAAAAPFALAILTRAETANVEDAPVDL
jgi:hypothetical protein